MIPDNSPTEEEIKAKQKAKEEDFGKVVDALHGERKLSSLRTYQGDMAEFIKERNESVLSIAAKEKIRKQEEQKEEKELQKAAKEEIGSVERLQTPFKRKARGNFQVNLTMIVLSILLLASGALAFYFVYDIYTRPPVPEAALQEQIIPYNNSMALAGAESQNLGEKISELNFLEGVNVIKVSDNSGKEIKTAKKLFEFLDISSPASLERSLRDDYVLGVFYQNGLKSNFLIITANDYEVAFSAMLDWEPNMPNDLAFLTYVPAPVAASSTPTGAASSTAAALTRAKVPAKSVFAGNFVWKDLIVKNKDTRALANEKNQAQLAYTFLDKNTVLITDNLNVIGDLFSIYVSRAVAR